MKRRSLILMILIVLLPVSLLTWLGVRMARDEQSVTQQRFRSVMQQRLDDVNRQVALRFEESQRRLHQITSVDDFDLSVLREVVRSEPQVTQLFVLSPDGRLMYPNPAGVLNGSELTFLNQAARMFTQWDLQNAIARTEAGAGGDRSAVAMSGSGGGAFRSEGEQRLSRSQQQADPSYGSAENVVNDQIAAGSMSAEAIAQQEAPMVGDAPPAPSPLEELIAAIKSVKDAGAEKKATTLDSAVLDENASPSVRMPAQPGNSVRSKAEVSQQPAPSDPFEAAAPEMAEGARGNLSAPAASSARTGPATGTAVETQATTQAAASAAPRQNEPSFSATDPAMAATEFAAPLSAEAADNDGEMAAPQMAAPDFSARAETREQPAPFLPSNGWFVWYWDRGLNLIYWQRRPSGHIVGAALERARWISDLISWLPETERSGSKLGSSDVQTAFRVLSSSSEVVYEWGDDVTTDAVPFCEAPVAAPLASWRLQCFIPPDQIATGGGRSAYLGFAAGLGAFAITLTSLAWLLYRDYSRDMREASQQVSFVNQVSHELKTPLTNIRLYADLLEHDLEQVEADQSEKPLRRLEVISSEAQRLSRLIGNVLTFARQQRKTLQLHPVSVNVIELVRQIADRFTPSLQNHGMEIQVSGGPGNELWLDPDFVEQILGNLISNVEKYAATGRHLEIRVAVSSEFATIDVIDAGPGIPTAHRASVFQPFSRLSSDLRASTGTGIGLSITRELARLHGGDVELKDSATGCWFQVRLKSQR
ncbi:MAG: ATP-binding protein [Planctomycetales bacterium]|nr:ATP-binding protein [Planctomycetales bacterium]